MLTNNKHIFFIAFLLTLSFIMRLCFNLIFVGIESLPGRSSIDAPDENKYHNMAISIINGQGFRGKAYNPPGYPLFLSLIYNIFGLNTFAVRIVQSLLSSIMVIFIFYIAQIAYDKNTAILAGLISMIYPFFVYWTGALLTETLFIFLYVISIFFIYRFLLTKSQLWNIVGSFSLGLTTLVRPVVLSLPLFILIFYLLNNKSLKSCLLNIFIFCLIYFSVLAPWTIRNYLIFDRFIPVTTSSGINLLAGMNKQVLNDINMSGKLTRGALDEYNEYLVNLDENQRDIEATKLAIGYYKKLFKENPLFIIKVMWKKWKAFWNIFPSNRGQLAKVMSLLSYGLLLPFFILGCILSIFRKNTLLIIFVILNSVIICLVYYANIRYRFPMEPFFIIVASFGILFIKEKLINKIPNV